jgi:hypothetical protein
MIQSKFEFAIAAVLNTPSWVWVIFIYLVYVGLKATKDRVIYLPKMLIVPIVLILLQSETLLSCSLSYLTFFSVGFVVGFFFLSRAPLEFLQNTKSVKVPGSYASLLIFLAFFLVKYSFGYLQATNPALATEYMLFEVATTALFSGYFLGRAACCLYRFKISL